MNRKVNIGDRVICQDNGTIGEVVNFYKESPFVEQTMVLTNDGRQYHAPTTSWAKTILNK